MTPVSGPLSLPGSRCGEMANAASLPGGGMPRGNIGPTGYRSAQSIIVKGQNLRPNDDYVDVILIPNRHLTAQLIVLRKIEHPGT